jgi:TetR/AcrR family transcriptional regulator, tetracycline repressor protein
VQLHKRDVIDKATAILDEYGLADLTMRRLARELDVSPGALYWHFANKQQLLGAVSDRILRPACADIPSGSWRTRISAIGSRLRDALLSHTDGAELVSASFAAGQSEALAQILERLTNASIEAGLAADHAGLAARTVVYYVLGFTNHEQSRLQWDAAGAGWPTTPDAAAAWPATPDTGALPDRESDPSSPADPSNKFIFGLKLLIDGVAAYRGHPSAERQPALPASR